MTSDLGTRRSRAALRWVLLALLLACPLRRAAAGEAAPSDPERVARLLTDPDERVRAEGRALLLDGIAAGGDVAELLRRVTESEALVLSEARAAAGESSGRADELRRRLVQLLIQDRASSDPAVSERAERLLEEIAPEEWAARRAEEKPPASGSPSEPKGPPAPGPVPAAPGAPRPDTVAGASPKSEAASDARTSAEAAPTLRARVTVLSLSRAELDRFLASGADDETRIALRLSPGPPGRDAPSTRVDVGLAGALQGLPDTRPIADTAVTLSTTPTAVVEPERVPWRREVVRTAGGAWAVEQGTLPRGLAVEASMARGPDGRATITVGATRTDVSDPMSTVKVRPAPDVEPVELDRPEWQVVACRASVALDQETGRGVVLLPDVLPDHVIAVLFGPPEIAGQAEAPRPSR